MQGLRKLLDSIDAFRLRPSTVAGSLPSLLLATAATSGEADDSSADEHRVLLRRLAEILGDDAALYTRGDWNLDRPPTSIVSCIAWNFAGDRQGGCFASALRGSVVQIAAADCRVLVSACEKLLTCPGWSPSEVFFSVPHFHERLMYATLVFAYDALDAHDVSKPSPHAACAWLACWETVSALVELLWRRSGSEGIVRQIRAFARDNSFSKSRSMVVVFWCIAATKKGLRADDRSPATQLLPLLLDDVELATAIFGAGCTLTKLMFPRLSPPSASPSELRSEGVCSGHADAMIRFSETLKSGFSDIVHTVFGDTIVRRAVPRITLRFLLSSALPQLAARLEEHVSPAAATTTSSCQSSGVVSHLLASLVSSWASDDVHQLDDRVLSTQCTAIMYALPLLCANNKLPSKAPSSETNTVVKCFCGDVHLMPSSKATGEVLRGVSNRFSAFHPDKSLRRQGALVAAAFAKLMMGDGGDESDEPRFEEFPSVLQEWDAEEQRQLPVGSGIPATAPVVEARVSQAVDAAVCQYPIDPDMRLVCVIRLPCHQYSAPPSEKRTTVEDSHRGGGGLRFSSVGVTEFPADGNDSLDHLRHIYSELLGMGDKNRQNETEHEAFDRVSSAMRSLPTVLQHLVNRSRLPNASSVLGQSIVMLLPGLFTSLFCFSHACPKDVEEELRVCRNKAALLLFSLNPKGALSSLSTLLYGSGTSVACKTELCTLVGDAVEILSAIPLAPPQTSPSSEAKHLVRYPPIGASTQAPKGQGFNTRRWGYAAHHVAGNVFSNEAADIAADVLQLFVKHADASEGGYSFEGDDMMFTPVEMLRAIGKLFASIALVRHVTPVIAPKALSFLQRFVLHALPLVRANAWMAIEKCMSSWRGFGARACSPDWAAAVLQVSGIATTLLSRENVPFVKSAILFFLQSVEGHVQDQLAN